MNILLTGSNGFIGKHMHRYLDRYGYNVFCYDIDNNEDDLIKFIKAADAVIHLAGVNRPKSDDEFYKGNYDLTRNIVDLIKKENKNIPILVSSSIQAALDNEYGKSKKLGEDYLLSSGLPVYVFRLANVFGKWARPNYNSACATFCYNIAHDLPVEIRDDNYVVHLNYVEDICLEFIKILHGDLKGSNEILYVNPTYDCSLLNMVNLLRYFKKEVESARHLPKINNDFELKLFQTFCDYLSDENYSFNFAEDQRGSFEEIYKSDKYGQISINTINPGYVKGGHYHTYKQEIFYPVIGEAKIRQRNIDNDQLIDDVIKEDNHRPVDIRIKYTHDIKNIGNDKCYVLMWISKIYNPETSDTYLEKV